MSTGDEIAKTLIRVLIGLVALAMGYAIYNFWQTTRPDDPSSSAIVAAIVVVFASFIAMYFMTKGGGD